MKKELFTKKKKGFDHTEKRFAYLHKTNPRQIATASRCGKFPRQKSTANSCGKLLPQIATANNHCRYIQRSANNVIIDTCCNEKKFHILSFNLRLNRYELLQNSKFHLQGKS